MLVLRTIASEMEEVATDTNNTTSQLGLPAIIQKTKVEHGFWPQLHDELDSYLTCTDSGPDVPSFWHEK